MNSASYSFNDWRTANDAEHAAPDSRTYFVELLLPEFFIIDVAQALQVVEILCRATFI